MLGGSLTRTCAAHASDERRSRKPLRADAREALLKKCGPPAQEVNFIRNESKPPAGRLDDLAPSRHERVPPQRIVLMFNWCVAAAKSPTLACRRRLAPPTMALTRHRANSRCALSFEASFSLAGGDILSLPEAETMEVRSLTSGKVLGRVKLAPEKGTPIEDRMAFVDNWFVGSEHGLHHDGLQADGFIELRLDWRDAHDNPRVALLRVVPWLAYGCGEGARLAVRKPGALEGTSSTVQRPLRDDSVVVKRDGTDNELTVDPTPFSVVPSSNPRHQPGTRLLILYEGSCVDGTVEKLDLDDIKEGSRHYLRIEGKLVTGWITKKTNDGTPTLNKVESAEDEAAAAAAPPPPPVVPPEGDAPAAAEEVVVDEDISGVWILNRKKMLAMHSGCDPQNSEKVASLTNKMPVRILQVRQTEQYGQRCYVSTIPSQSSIMLTIALNEFNHSVQRFPSVAEYEAARANCETLARAPSSHLRHSPPATPSRLSPPAAPFPLRSCARAPAPTAKLHSQAAPAQPRLFACPSAVCSRSHHHPLALTVALCHADCEDIVVREALVEDAITGNELRIKDQTLYISTATDAVDNAKPIPPEVWLPPFSPSVLTTLVA